MAIIRWKKNDMYDPWSELSRLQTEINDLFDIDRFPTTSGLFDRPVSPAIDVIENPDNYKVISELPGIELKDIDVSITSNVLTIKGEKKEDKEEKKGKYYRKESLSGGFQRTLSLPTSVESEKVQAELKNGILTITLPKKEEAKPKQITVNIMEEGR
ncbi:MAG: Hsp20/alpha crystallin family protein [Spirochaetales bacterium]|nr:Hsp20/alpha crystallin family protein [Spirochaetales bacterium]